jgi:hypothetical protein
MGIGAGGGKVLAVGCNSTETSSAVLSSSDGITWTPQLISAGEIFRDITWFTFEGVAPQFVVVGARPMAFHGPREGRWVRVRRVL